jgi:hypothetical protein
MRVTMRHLRQSSHAVIDLTNNHTSPRCYHALAAFSVESPTKPSRKHTKSLIDNELRSVSPDDVTWSVEKALERKLQDDLEEIRKKFVGEIELPECKSYIIVEPGLINVTCRRGTTT